MSAPSCFPGRVLNGRYRLDEIVGKGAVATVWRGYDLQGERVCAIKMLNPATAGDSRERRRLAREGALVSRMCHPNLPLMHALDVTLEGAPFLVMEYLPGRTLRDLLQLRGRLSFAQASHLLRQVGSALASAHAMGVLHRDLKPQNIVLQVSTSATDQAFDVLQAVVKVIDFGSAGEREKSDEASICAPLARDIEYRAPELQEEGGPVDARADQWSLAVVAYEILAGVQPFRDADPVHLALQIRDGRFTPLSLHRPDLPAYVAAAIDRALSVKPSDRFASVTDFVRALHGDWPRMFRVATPLRAEPEGGPAAELFGAVSERSTPPRLPTPFRAAAGLLLAMLAFAMPFSFTAGVAGHRYAPAAGVSELTAERLTSSATNRLDSPRTTARSPIPPLRAADPLPGDTFPPLRLPDEK